MKNLPITVIVSTYNSEDWLRKVLEGYKHQTYDFFEVIVVDDGSKETTKELIDSFKADYPVTLRHIWHEDQGYRRQRILNIAITKAANDYILFTDGDCIPRCDFVAEHAKYAEKGYFLSGGYCKLNMDLSTKITQDDIANAYCFDTKWLNTQGDLGFKQGLKISAGATLSKVLDFLTPTGATFNNCNSSAWKSDLLAVNGYDERMKYGGPDREIGERLVNFKIRPKQIRHQAICLHLDHPRGYKTKESLARNLEIRRIVKAENRTWTNFGIIKSEE